MRIPALYAVLIELLCAAALAQGPAQPTGEFKEIPIVFGSLGNRTNGVLCLPKAVATRVPVAVLVTGSGFPGDDRSVAEDNFYAALSRALASRGVASIRSGVHATSANGKVTPPELEVAMGVSALEYAATRSELNANAIYVLGYDAGARLVPRIAARYPRTRGFILMGGDMLPAEQILATRTRRQLEQQGKSEQDIRQELASQNQTLADIRDGKVPSSRMIYGAPANYWLEWMNRNPLADLRELTIPALVLQGGRDHVVSEEASQKLQAALGPFGVLAVFRGFEGLDHQFAQAQTGTQQAPIDQNVIETLRGWIVSYGSSEKKR